MLSVELSRTNSGQPCRARLQGGFQDTEALKNNQGRVRLILIHSRLPWMSYSLSMACKLQTEISILNSYQLKNLKLSNKYQLETTHIDFKNWKFIKLLSGRQLLSSRQAVLTPREWLLGCVTMGFLQGVSRVPYNFNWLVSPLKIGLVVKTLSIIPHHQILH